MIDPIKKYNIQLTLGEIETIILRLHDAPHCIYLFGGYQEIIDKLKDAITTK